MTQGLGFMVSLWEFVVCGLGLGFAVCCVGFVPKNVASPPGARRTAFPFCVNAEALAAGLWQVSRVSGRRS